jgi:hypothetical protein
VAKALAYQATLQGYDVRYLEADTEFARYALAGGQNRANMLQELWLSHPREHVNSPQKVAIAVKKSGKLC